MSDESLDFNNAIGDMFDMAAKASEQYAQLFSKITANNTSKDDPSASVMTDFSHAFKEFSEKLMEDPNSLMAKQVGLMKNQMNLWQQTALRFAGQENDTVIEPDSSDKRFNDEEWSENILFDYIKQFYLLQSKAITDVVDDVNDLSEHSKGKVDFLVRQFVSALSPSNFAATNPEVIRKTLETHGSNLIDGVEQLNQDLNNSFGGLNVSMSDTSAFKVGRNVATTPGKVIYQNELMQLIQYTPTTTKVNKRPLLIVSPFINKYYILDLKEENSFIKWLVDQGHTLFCISWINPGAELKDKGFEDYMKDGPLTALDVIQKVTGESEINAIGYCIGGTLLAATLAYMKKKKDNRIKSATYLASLIDFEDPGEIGIYINETAISALEKQMDGLGYYDGRLMSFSFNLLRENDLFWSFFINNYLKGQRPVAFDLLYWNTDSTNLPAKMHSFYLRNMYLENLLKEKDGIELDGVKLDIGQVDTPCYFVSTATDHIAKWKSTYSGAKLFKGDVRFTLSGSGHIAGIVNPPSANKYGYWTNDELPKDPDNWFKGANKNDGSWWNDWQTWVKKSASGQVKARKPGEGKLKVIEDAPGAYVCKRLTGTIPGMA